MSRKVIWKLGLLLAAGILTGAALLCLAYCFPAAPMQGHMRESVDAFVREGDNPFLMAGYKGSSLDNTTDATMLGDAVYRSSLPFYKAAMLVERGGYDGAQEQEALKRYLDGEEPDWVSAYSRYWHGYLLVLKPLLLILNYRGIRMLNGIAMAALTLLVFWRMYARKMKSGMIALLLALAGLFPVTLPLSLQFASVYYVGTGACLLILWKYERMEETGGWPYFFLLTGMLTSYMDFLTYPLFTLGMPLTIYIALQKAQWKDGALKILRAGVCWSVGYIGMWAGKWLLGSALTGSNVLQDAIGAVGNRISTIAYEEKVSRLFAVLRNLYIYWNPYGFALAGLLALWIALFLWRNGKKGVDRSRAALLLGIASMPIVWYLCTVNHSFTHYWYTFRSLAVSVFAVGMIPEACKRGAS